jgi:hypothetical protein
MPMGRAEDSNVRCKEIERDDGHWPDVTWT